MSGFFSKMFGNEGDAGRFEDRDYARVIADTAEMTKDAEARRLAKRHGLEILNLTWEDTARFKGSAVGPNISDMTIQVQHYEPRRGQPQITCMPVIRFPNFSDRTADVALDALYIRVGNERGGSLRRIALREYLSDLRRFLSRPESWAGGERSLLASSRNRDRDVLVSAQACFLPVPKSGRAEFNPVLFNYQSYRGAPAVLAILATREGTSATIIDNQRDAFAAGHAWGQRLFFNQNGQRASLTGTRIADFVAQGGDDNDQVKSLEAAKQRGLNQVLLIQVPLIQPEHRRSESTGSFAVCGAPAAAAEGVARSARRRGESSDVEEAVIGHGEIEGPFTEIDHLPIRRDPRFPIRVTVQFYQATSNGVASAEDLRLIADRIDAVYRDARVVGSLVTDGDTGRSTEWDDHGLGKREPSDWWAQFWRRQEAATGRSREQMLRDLERVLGRRPSDRELEEAIRRVFDTD